MLMSQRPIFRKGLQVIISRALTTVIPYEKIPGPKALPLLGVAHHFLPGGQFHKKELKDFLQQMKSAYGDVVRMKGTFGKPDIVFLFNPRDIENVFRSEGKWPYRRGQEILNEFRTKERPDLFNGVGGLVHDQGAAWQETRTKVNPVMMQPKIIGQYIQPVEGIASEFVERIRKIRDEKMEVPADFAQETSNWSLESIACIAMDQRLDLIWNKDPQSDGQQLIRAIHDFFSLSVELEMMPSIWKYYKTPQYKKMMDTMHKMTNIITKFIDRSVEGYKKRPTDAAQGNSVLEKLLQIDSRVAIIMAMDMLMAGVDTTSTATLGVLYQLAKNPEKQEILRREVMEKLPNKDSKLTPESMANMPYLRAVIKETLRLRPVTIGTARRTPEEIVINGYSIPKGIDVMLTQILMTTDENFFGRCQEFLPERFLKNEKMATDLKGNNPFSFLPFGFGSRMCIGKRFAELEIEILISKILRHYKIEWHYADVKYASKSLYMPIGDLKFRFLDLK